MSTINTNVVLVAIKAGKVTRTITKDDRLILTSAVVTANNIYHEVKKSGENGCTLKTLMDELGLRRETISLFLKLFGQQSLITIAPILPGTGGVPKNIYFVNE